MHRPALVLAALIAAAAGCPDAEARAGCLDVDDACPSLVCVARRRDEAGCQLCECAVQACLRADDCAPRDVAAFCDVSPLVCEPAPACTDGDDATPCPAACFGRCRYEGDPVPVRADGFCGIDLECASGTCRRDDRVCVDDPLTPAFDCIGWCVDGCAEGETTAFDERTGQCAVFPDSCTPPGWTPLPSGSCR